MKKRHFPRLLGECVEQLTKPVLQQHGMVEARLIRHWEQIVGPELAMHATPHRLINTKEGGTLVIRAPGGFATEIQHMEPVILERLATWLGYRAATRIRIEQVAAPVPTRKAAPNPADAEMRKQLHQLAEALQTGKA